MGSRLNLKRNGLPLTAIRKTIGKFLSAGLSVFSFFGDVNKPVHFDFNFLVITLVGKRQHIFCVAHAHGAIACNVVLGNCGETFIFRDMLNS